MPPKQPHKPKPKTSQSARPSGSHAHQTRLSGDALSPGTILSRDIAEGTPVSRQDSEGALRARLQRANQSLNEAAANQVQEEAMRAAGSPLAMPPRLSANPQELDEIRDALRRPAGSRGTGATGGSHTGRNPLAGDPTASRTIGRSRDGSQSSFDRNMIGSSPGGSRRDSGSRDLEDAPESRAVRSSTGLQEPTPEPIMGGGLGPRPAGVPPPARKDDDRSERAPRKRKAVDADPESGPSGLTKDKTMGPPSKEKPAAKRARLASEPQTPRKGGSGDSAPATPRVGGAITGFLKWCDRCIRNDCNPQFGRDRWAPCTGRPPKNIRNKKCGRCVDVKHPCKWTHREEAKAVIRRMYAAREELARRQAHLRRCRAEVTRANAEQLVDEAQEALDEACIATKEVMGNLSTNDSKIVGGDPTLKGKGGGGGSQASRELTHETARLANTNRALLELFTQVAEHHGVPVDRAAVNATLGVHSSSEEEEEEEEFEEISSEEEDAENRRVYEDF